MVTLRDDQTALVDRLRGAMRRHRHVCLQAGCGYGKTTVFSEVTRAADAAGKRVVILAHRRRLIDQISDRLAAFGVRHGVVMADLPAKLKERSVRAARVQVCSKDTLVSRALRNEWDGLPQADLLIPDEAHNLLAAGYAKLVGCYDRAFRLGPTATPAAGDGRGLAGFFGEMVQALPVSQCITRGLNVPVRVYAALDMKDVRATGGRVKPAGDPVAQWLKHAGGRPTVAFAPTVAASQQVVLAYNAAGVPAVHIDAHTPEAERDAAADGLESGALKVVSQVGLWTEGVDVPCLAVCQLLCRCGSLVKYVQAVGRVMRAFPGKGHAVVIDHTGAVFEHGFPDDDLEWSLTPGSVCKKAPAGGDDGEGGGDREPFVCARCGLAYAGSATCPGCGSGLAVNRKMYQPDLFAHLTEIDRDFTEAARDEEPQRQWTRLRYQFARAGKTVKQLVGAFYGRYRRGPEEAGVDPLPARDDYGLRVADVWPDLLGRGPKRVAAGAGLFTGDDE